MTTRTEAIAAALEAAIGAQVAAGVTVRRGEPLAHVLEDGARSVIVLSEGDAELVDRTIGVESRLYRLPVACDCVVQGETPAARKAALDVLVSAVGAAVAADRTLGGLTRYLDAAPQGGLENVAIDGDADLRGCTVTVEAWYFTGDNPLA